MILIDTMSRYKPVKLQSSLLVRMYSVEIPLGHFRCLDASHSLEVHYYTCYTRGVFKFEADNFFSDEG